MKLSVKDIAYIALFAVFIAVCSWIYVPFAVPFTMQTFGVFLTLTLLGGKRGTLAVLTYLLLGIAGAPVFAGFSGGIGYLFGATGGFCIGFLFSSLVFWLFERLSDKLKWVTLLSSAVSLTVCYICGTLWFAFMYSGKTDIISAVLVCVIPYIIPDIIKLSLSITLGNKLRKICKI